MLSSESCLLSFLYPPFSPFKSDSCGPLLAQKWLIRLDAWGVSWIIAWNVHQIMDEWTTKGTLFTCASFQCFISLHVLLSIKNIHEFSSQIHIILSVLNSSGFFEPLFALKLAPDPNIVEKYKSRTALRTLSWAKRVEDLSQELKIR